VVFAWNFGDGYTSNVAAPLHAYTANGLYDVALTAKDTNNCRDTLIRPAYIQVGAIAMPTEAEHPELAVYPNPFATEVEVHLPEWLPPGVLCLHRW
jgi:PKD repeat protein